jgi:HK97 family phage major capsid protein
MSGTHQAIKRAFEARRKNQEALVALYDGAENRELTSEELFTENTIVTDLRDLADREIELVDLSEKEARAAEYFAASAASGTGEGKREDEKRHLGQVLKDIAVGEQRQARIELRDDVALVSGTGTDGAELIETELSRSLVDFLQEGVGALQANARVIVTSSGNPITIPTVTSHSTILLEGEGDTIARSAPQFSTIQLDAYKYAVLVQASRELLEDSAFPFVPFVIEQATDEISRLISAALTTGSGSGQPQGIDLAATNSVTSASATEWTADELIDVYHAINSRYRQNAVWMLADSTVQEFRKLKDSSGQYLWQPGMVAGQPDMLFGKKVVTDNDVMATATGNESIIFGDLKRAYTVRLVGGLDVARSDDFAFDTDLVTWRFVARADGALVDENAVVIGHNA